MVYHMTPLFEREYAYMLPILRRSGVLRNSINNSQIFFFAFCADSSRMTSASNQFESVHSSTEPEETNKTALQYPDVRGKTVAAKPLVAATEELQDPSEALDLHRTEEEHYRREYMEKRDALLSLLQQTHHILQDFVNDDEGKHHLLYCAQLPSDRSTFNAMLQSYRVFRIDLKPTGSRASSAAASHLDQSTNTTLLLQKMEDCLVHLDRLMQRVQDTRSKVLVTGDINCGKSTMINALLRREILPHDQQPCTAAFCEVMDAETQNDAKEEVHAIVDPSSYDRHDDKTFSRFPLAQLMSVHQSNDQYQLWRIYVGRKRNDEINVLHNGLVDVTLIDSPGLNRDLSQTMAVFAQHEAIDAVIFVVNAENHFTLSVRFYC